jgi:hypothetical protein
VEEDDEEEERGDEAGRRWLSSCWMKGMVAAVRREMATGRGGGGRAVVWA